MCLDFYSFFSVVTALGNNNNVRLLASVRGRVRSYRMFVIIACCEPYL